MALRAPLGAELAVAGRISSPHYVYTKEVSELWMDEIVGIGCAFWTLWMAVISQENMEVIWTILWRETSLLVNLILDIEIFD